MRSEPPGSLWSCPSLQWLALYKNELTTTPKTQATSCHQLTVFGAPRLSSWWMATSTWSEAIFVTWIEVPPSQILILSMLKVQFLNNRCCRLRFWVSFLFAFEAPKALIYNESAPTLREPPNPAAERPDRDIDRLPNISGNTYY